MLGRDFRISSSLYDIRFTFKFWYLRSLLQWNLYNIWGWIPIQVIQVKDNQKYRIFIFKVFVVLSLSTFMQW